MSLDEDPVRKSAGFKDGEKSVDQDEAPQTLPNGFQGRSTLSQVAIANPTTEKDGQSIWH